MEIEVGKKMDPLVIHFREVHRSQRRDPHKNGKAGQDSPGTPGLGVLLVQSPKTCLNLKK